MRSDAALEILISGPRCDKGIILLEENVRTTLALSARIGNAGFELVEEEKWKRERLACSFFY
jgi:hypothetical protein